MLSRFCEKRRWTPVVGSESQEVSDGKRQRRSFADDYQRQAVDLVTSSGRSIGSVAKELGLRNPVLRRWVERRGAGREPTAAARRPTTQATLICLGRLPQGDTGPAGFRASMSRKADCYDNAPMERFFHTLKTELVHHRQYATRARTPISLPTLKASTIELGVTRLSATSARSRWS